MELFSLVDLIILSWEGQGFSATGFGGGLSDTKSGLFMDMVRLITWAQSISPTLGYVMKTPLLSLTKRKKSRSTTRWLSITLESCFYLMWHNAVPMHTGYAIGAPTL
jgi:hypothetical protein